MQVKNELDQEHKQKVQDQEKEKEKDKVLSFADKVRMNMAGQSIKQKAILQADEDEFVPLDITEEDYQKIKDKKNAEKKKRGLLTRNSDPAQATGPRKFFSNTEKKSDKKEEENEEERKAREQKQNEQLQKQLEKEREMEERMQKEQAETTMAAKKVFSFRDAPREAPAEVRETRQEEPVRFGFQRGETKKEEAPVVYKSRFTSSK